MSQILEWRSLVNERRGVLQEMGELLKKREWTPEETTKFTTLETQVKDIDARLKEVEKSPTTSSTDPGQRSAGRQIINPFGNEERNFSGPESGDSKALRSWFRMGTSKERPEDGGYLDERGLPRMAQEISFRAQSVGSNSGGGYTVPTGFFAEISSTLKNVCPIRQLARVLTTDNGETLKMPTNDDTANAAVIVDENTDNDVQDFTYGQISLGAWIYTTKQVIMSNQLIEDSGVDISSWVAQALGSRMGRGQEPHFLTGNGTTQPQGVITAASTTSAGSATAIGISDLINLMAAVDPAYITNNASVAWLMHPTVWAYVRKLVDSQGRPLLGNVQDGAGLSLLGYPVLLTSAMDSTIASTKKTVVFGAWNNYLIRDVREFTVAKSTERYFEKQQTAFLGFMRTDAKVLQTGAFRVLLH